MGALVLAAAILFFTGLGRGTLWDQDEPRYAEAAREILQTKDPITLHINGTPWFVHPPLYIWLQALTGWAFGFSEFSARLWSAIFGVAGTLVTYNLGRMFFSVRAATLGAVILMTMAQYYAQARLGIFDIALVVFMLLAVYTFLRSLREPSPGLAVWAFVWAGLGTLTKGPIALVLPALVVMAWLWTRGELHRWHEIPWRAALLVYTAIVLPWYALETIRHGWPFLGSVIGYYTITRFVGVVENQSGPWWYYGPVLLTGAFPWSGFLLAMVPYHIQRWREEGSALVLLWCGITFLFYTVAGTKLPNYILPIYPMAALGIGLTWDRALSGDGRARQALGTAFALTLVFVVVIAGGIRAFGATHYPADFAVLQQHLARVAAGILGGLIGATACYYGLRRPLAAFVVLTGTMVALAGVLTYRTLPLVDAHRPIKAIASAARAELRPADALIGLRLIAQQTLMYYANHHVEWIEDPAALTTALCRHPRAVIVTPSDEYRTWAYRAIGPSGRVLAEQDGLIAVLKDGPIRCDEATGR
jgi:4-amino-4-deoxy-L-arabinose transferase-like glycosyltransferase